jgi:hypothetical protein
MKPTQVPTGDFRRDSAIVRYTYDLYRAVVALRELGFSREDIIEAVDQSLEWQA